jgi:MFS family permease
MDTRKTLKLFIVLGLVACLAGFASDVYAPLFLTMATQLKASLSGLQRTMSVFMLALALTQLFYGSLSEAFGRRIPLLIGLVVMIIGNLVCAWAQSLYILMLGRFIQGAGAGAFAPFGAIAGYAAGVYSSIQLGGGAVIGWISSFIPSNKPYPLALIFIATALCAWVLFERQNKRIAS